MIYILSLSLAYEKTRFENHPLRMAPEVELLPEAQFSASFPPLPIVPTPHLLTGQSTPLQLTTPHTTTPLSFLLPQLPFLPPAHLPTLLPHFYSVSAVWFIFPSGQTPPLFDSDYLHGPPPFSLSLRDTSVST